MISLCFRANESDNEYSLLSLDATENKCLVHISNVLTEQLEAADFNELVNTFLAQSSRYEQMGTPSDVVKSIRVFTNSVYVNFDDETLAQDACAFLNNYAFKTFQLKTGLILNSKKHEQEQNAADTDEFDLDSSQNRGHLALAANKYKFSTDCQILIENRQLKYEPFAYFDLKLKRPAYQTNMERPAYQATFFS